MKIFIKAISKEIEFNVCDVFDDGEGCKRYMFESCCGDEHYSFYIFDNNVDCDCIDVYYRLCEHIGENSILYSVCDVFSIIMNDSIKELIIKDIKTIFIS